MQLHHIWVINGASGCGKTTLAKFLADALDVAYVEGDAHHPKVNVEKMRRGIPLTDADRWDWLTVLRDEFIRRVDGGSRGAVVSCSALKRKYRDVMRIAAYFRRDIAVHFIFLSAPADVLLERVARRQGHFMGPDMLRSQFETLEAPFQNEHDVVTIDVDRSIEEIRQDAMAQVFVIAGIDE